MQIRSHVDPAPTVGQAPAHIQLTCSPPGPRGHTHYSHLVHNLKHREVKQLAQDHRAGSVGKDGPQTSERGHVLTVIFKMRTQRGRDDTQATEVRGGRKRTQALW